MVVEEAAIFLSVTTGLVEGEGAVVSIVRSRSVDVAVLPNRPVDVPVPKVPVPKVLVPLDAAPKPKGLEVAPNSPPV